MNLRFNQNPAFKFDLRILKKSTYQTKTNEGAYEEMQSFLSEFDVCFSNLEIHIFIIEFDA